MASCSGTARQAPNLLCEATLITSEDAPPEPVRNRAGRLPDGPDSQYRVWNPAMRGLSRV